MKIPKMMLWKIPSLKLTYPLTIDPWKRRFLLETIIFRGYASFRECISLSNMAIWGILDFRG